MHPMPVPQLAPPGHLDQHGLLVALTPVLLCLAAALALHLINGGRGGGRASRALAALNLAGALVFQALFLVPWGPAAAYTEPLAGGLVRVGWLETGTAFMLGCWAAWRWRPWRVASSSARWCLRVALALALPVIAVPVLALAALADVTEAEGRRCWLAGAVVLAVTGVIVGAPTLSPWCVWMLHALAMTAAVALAGRGPWAVPLVIATLAAWRFW
jgi:hypothetical protein